MARFALPYGYPAAESLTGLSARLGGRWPAAISSAQLVGGEWMLWWAVAGEIPAADWLAVEALGAGDAWGPMGG